MVGIVDSSYKKKTKRCQALPKREFQRKKVHTAFHMPVLKWRSWLQFAISKFALTFLDTVDNCLAQKTYNFLLRMPNECSSSTKNISHKKMQRSSPMKTVLRKS